MKHNFYNTLSVITTGAILGLFAIAPNQAQAAAIKFDFISTFDTPNDDLLGFGILRYDSAPITGVGNEVIQMNQLIGVNLDLNALVEISLDVPGVGLITDSIFIDESDVVPPSPFLNFTDNQLTGFTDTINTTSNTLGVPIIAQASGTTFDVFAVDPTSDVDSPNLILVEQGDIVFSTVPEPGTILGLSFFCLGSLMYRKKLVSSL